MSDEWIRLRDDRGCLGKCDAHKRKAVRSYVRKFEYHKWLDQTIVS